LDLYYFISNRINKGKKGSFSATVSTIAVVSITIGLFVMIISFAILQGFRNQIQDKIFSFGSHIQITSSNRMGYAESPLSLNRDIYKNWERIPEIAHIQGVTHNLGMLKKKSGDEFTGAIMKGVGKDFNIDQFQQNIVAGRFIHFQNDTFEIIDGKKEKKRVWSKEVVVSKKIANRLQVAPGDKLLMFFVKRPLKIRPLQVVGIYETGLEEFDDLIIIGDNKLNQDLNGWNDTIVGAFEIFLKDFNKFREGYFAVHDAMDSDMFIDTSEDKYIQIFDWLTLLDRNVIIFLCIILFLACFNMASTLFIMIMERTNMIGLLKALGASNGQIKKIFFYNGMLLILKGLLFGNILGLGFCFIQYYFKIIPLDAQNYYMSTVPIEWNWPVFALLNLLTFVLVLMVLFIPMIVISNIKPIKAIKFD